MGDRVSALVFDVPKLPFKELPKIPECFCQYPIIFAMTYDMTAKAWFWRIDVQFESQCKWVNLNIPAPVFHTGLPEPMTLHLFAECLKLLGAEILKVDRTPI